MPQKQQDQAEELDPAPVEPTPYQDGNEDGRDSSSIPPEPEAVSEQFESVDPEPKAPSKDDAELANILGESPVAGDESNVSSGDFSSSASSSSIESINDSGDSLKSDTSQASVKKKMKKKKLKRGKRKSASSLSRQPSQVPLSEDVSFSSDKDTSLRQSSSITDGSRSQEIDPNDL